MKNTDQSVKRLDCITKEINFRMWRLYLVQHMLHQIKKPQFYTDLGL